MSQPQPPDGTSAPVAPPSRARGRQTALDMVRSLVLILGIVVVVLLLAPQPGRVQQPQLGDAVAAQAVDAAADALGAAPLLLRGGAADGPGLADADVPSAAAVVTLGEGWRLDYARTEETSDVLTWRVGVLSPDERRVDLEQAVDPDEDWLTRSDVGRAGLPEPVELGGLTWTRQERGTGETSYSHAGEAQDEQAALTTAVTATSDSDDLRQVVEQVAAALQR